MTALENIVLAWWHDQWGGAKTDTIIAGRAEHGVPSIDETEVALMRAAEALADKHKNCKHTHRQGTGSAGSDGSSSFTGFCTDCGKDLSYKIEGQLADPMLQLQSRN